MTTTIVSKFDEKGLPKWAQKDTDVVSLCRKSLSFRANVCAATTKDYQRFLRREARRMATTKI